MKINLDENISYRAVETLRLAGHDVVTVISQKMTSATDPILMEVCRKEGRALVTLDMEFANPLKFPPRKYHGIAVLRLPRRPKISDLFHGISILIMGLRDNAISGKLWIVEKGRIREHQPE